MMHAIEAAGTSGLPQLADDARRDVAVVLLLFFFSISLSLSLPPRRRPAERVHASCALVLHWSSGSSRETYYEEISRDSKGISDSDICAF